MHLLSHCFLQKNNRKTTGKALLLLSLKKLIKKGGIYSTKYGCPNLFPIFLLEGNFL